MVRSYLRHEPTQAFGVICSNTARSVLDADGKTAYVPALEDVIVWDVRKGEQVDMWHEIGHRSPVTALTRCPAAASSHLFAVGYEDGSIRLWDSTTSSVHLTFNGHRKAVSSLAFDAAGMRLASGSQDTTIILWDLVAETGMFRLKSHRDLITDLAFVQLSVHSEASTSSLPEIIDVNASGHLLSTSKDGLLKIWDLALQHCIETVVPGKGELWSLAVLPIGREDAGSSERVGDSLVVTGSAEGEAKVWVLRAEVLAQGLQAMTGDGSDKEKVLVALGNVELASKRRVTQVAYSSLEKGISKAYLAISSSDRSVQVFRMREEEEMKKKIARRKRRQREKADKKGTAKALNGEQEDEEDEQVTWLDRIEPYTIIRPESGKIRSFAFPSGPDTRAASSSRATSASMSILCATHANSVEVYNIPSPPKSKAEKKVTPTEASLACSLELPGHRSEVRALGLSSDDSLLASADSQGSFKVWNIKTGRCIRTLACGYALTLAWLPGDRHVVVGCKDGSIRTYDIPAGENIETIQAHTGPVWSIALHPDGLQCISASADKDVKFWEFEMRTMERENGEVDQESDEEEPAPGAPPRRPKPSRPQQLGLAHVRTLKMTDDVLFARFSPNGKLLALSLLDNTVKVFYADSLKFFLSLYGHKLPVLSLDISTDSKLCVTVSADKNIKIWGLDYGDCHKSIFGHQESIMSCAFEKGFQGGGLLGGREGESHHFWTVGKDGLVKYWDGDRFELIQTMEGHHGEVWSLACGQKGDLVVSSGADRSLRVWEKTEEPLFLEEEREKEQEKLFEQAEREARDREEGQVGAVGSLAGGQTAQEGVEQQEATAVTHSSTQTLMAGERLMEALDLADEDKVHRREWIQSGRRGAAPPRSALILAAFPEGQISSTVSNKSASAAKQGEEEAEEDTVPELYVLKVVEKILPAQLDDALLTLPFDKVLSLMRYLAAWAHMNLSIALLSRILFFLLRTHHAQIVSNAVMRSTLVELQGSLKQNLRRQKIMVGYNLVGLRELKKQDEQGRVAALYEKEGFEGSEEEMRRRAAEEGGGVTRKRKANVA
ncbi:WD40 repeat-like protein [Microstroma glucosiphilum]|uniref:WD40 repeat-like protein n=1 Tax=Pseudomicrostroma glucosiphilum TaxID=1684307 RepID=A0A316UGN0_9BASI|nr:WD40 repeat-like protein [Pseudomicrostroma glucosiphilum]PWN22325.1 WD40 repeat-like protein [Pseudomicrostroma glucosiphilum]